MLYSVIKIKWKFMSRLFSALKSSYMCFVLGGREAFCQGRWKNTLGKLMAKVNLEAIWLEFWMKGAIVSDDGKFCSSVIGDSQISLI